MHDRHFPYPHFRLNRPPCSHCTGTRLRRNGACPASNCEFAGGDSDPIRRNIRNMMSMEITRSILGITPVRGTLAELLAA